jgi:hypothetical protein
MTRRLVAVLVVVGCSLWTASAFTQKPAQIKGDAILKHPVGALAIKSADLITAGKIDEYYALRVADDRAEWKAASASDRREISDLLKDRVPTSAVLTETIRQAGVLTIEGDRAALEASNIMGIFVREGGQWRVSIGPAAMGPPPAGPETRLERAAILKHPIANLALQYADAVHVGNYEQAMPKLFSSEAQTRWKREPASEHAESLAYLRKMIPARAAMAKLIPSSGLLIIEGDVRATLNLIVTTQAPGPAGVVTSTSTTTAIPFVVENGQWKVAQ